MEKIIHIIQGEQAIATAPDVIITTVLGSCVAACLFDAEHKIGGMNHFLLADDGCKTNSNDMRFASASMERLVNGLLKQGAQRSRLQAKLFGGAHMMAGLPDIGQRNGEAARAFLIAEGIPCNVMSLGGTTGRRIRFWPSTGRAQQLLLHALDTDPVIPLAPRSGSIELF